MILKIFTKRKPGGELVETDLQWKDEYIEADNIKLSPTKEGFDYWCHNGGKEAHGGGFSTESHGYEIRNNKGLVIDRYVTAVK